VAGIHNLLDACRPLDSSISVPPALTLGIFYILHPECIYGFHSILRLDDITRWPLESTQRYFSEVGSVFLFVKCYSEEVCDSGWQEKGLKILGEPVTVSSCILGLQPVQGFLTNIVK
jgi:hypothetical protein